MLLLLVISNLFQNCLRFLFQGVCSPSGVKSGAAVK